MAPSSSVMHLGEVGPRRSRAKLKGDFEGAQEVWKKAMKRWEVVINDREGLEADAKQEIEKLRAEHSDCEIDVLGPIQLEKLALELSASDLGNLCGAILIDSD